MSNKLGTDLTGVRNTVYDVNGQRVHLRMSGCFWYRRLNQTDQKGLRL